jgi:putative spermidine/putrescine transport system substrate-binding protein
MRAARNTDDRPRIGERPPGASRVRPALVPANPRIVVGTFGGDYARLLATNIETPLLSPHGWRITQHEADDAARRAQMFGERDRPQGSTDLQRLSVAFMQEMNAAGILETLDYSRIPNATHLLPAMRLPYGIGHIYSGKIILYNPKLVARAASFADTLNPQHGSKLGIIDAQYHHTMMAAALASGGTMADFEPGKARLLACRKAGARLYPTAEELAGALRVEEIALCIMWKARAVQWQSAGLPIETVAAAEGIPLYISGFAMPKNAPNKDGAYAYLDAILAPQAQAAFARDLGYNPTVTNAALPPDLERRIGFTPDEHRRLLPLDNAYLARNDQALRSWWDTVFKGESRA